MTKKKAFDFRKIRGGVFSPAFCSMLFALSPIGSNTKTIGYQLSQNLEPSGKTASSSQKLSQNAEEDSARIKKTPFSEKKPPKLYLLEKLESLDRALPEDYAGKTALQLRKAHVLALLAEENFIKSKEPSCSSCFKKAQAQAKKSLSLYEKLSPILFESRQFFLQTELLFQKAYLERILGNRRRALAHLQKITERDNLKMDWRIRAWYGIGEIEFELYNYQKALQAFQKVLTDLSKLEGDFDSTEPALDKSKQSSWKFKALYHKIWSLFNLSSYELALNEMLSLISSDLYKKASFDFWTENQTLKAKLEKEMITIYSYAGITDKNLKILYDFSKQREEENTPSKRKERLAELALVLKNMGRLKQSNKAWRFYLSKNNSKENQLRAWFSIFRNKLSFTAHNKWEELVPILEKIFSLQAELFPRKAGSHQEEPVVKNKKTLRASKKALAQSAPSSKKQSLYDSINLKIKELFYQVDNIKSSLNINQKRSLLSLYQKYNRQNPRDKDILPLSAILAEALKQYKLAVSLFQQSALHVKHIKKIKDQDEKTQLLWKEKFCVKQIELAELSKDKKTRLKAYSFYIQQGQKTALKYRALYQTAYLYHQDQEFSKSQPLLLKLAMDDFNSNEKALFEKNQQTKKEQPEKELRLKAARLYLSQLADQKGKETELIRSSGLFKKEFPKEKAEFVKIYNLAVLNYVEKLAGDKSFSQSPLTMSQDISIQKAWAVLQLFDSQAGDRKHLEIYHLNRMILGKELLKIDEMEQSLHFLISDKRAVEENRKTALKEQLWLAEIKFDFEQLLSLLKQLKPEDKSKEHLLRLIQLAELSDKNPSPYYEDFLNRFATAESAGASGSKAPPFRELERLKSIFISWLELSERQKQKQLLKAYSSLFKDNPKALLYRVLKADQGEMDRDFLNHFAEGQLKADSFLLPFLRRKQNLESFKKTLSLSKRDPEKISSSQTAQAVKSYSKQLSQLEKSSLSFLKTEDWTSQVFIVGHWLRELKSFYRFVFQLPVPKGLTEKEKSDYKNLLVEQMTAYANKISELEKKQKQLFSYPFVSAYEKALQSYVFHPYLKWEMSQISEFLREEDQKKIQSFILQIENSSAKQAQMKKPELKNINSDIEKIYKKLRSNPFDMKNLKTALKLEKRRSHKVRVRYLSDRIQQLESNRQAEKNKSKNKIKGV